MTDIENTETNIFTSTLIPEEDLVEKLRQHDLKEQVGYKIDGVVSVSILQQIANNLNYEVQILVNKDLSATHFITGRELYALSNDEKEKLGFGKNVICDAHNHPGNSSSLPSPSDFMQGMKAKVVYLSIGIDGVTERHMPKRLSIIEGIHDHLIKLGETPWRVGDNYDNNLKEEALRDLNSYPDFKDLSDDKRQVELDRRVRYLDYRNYNDLFIQAGRDLWEPYMKSYLDSQSPPWIKHFPWTQEQEINNLLRGHSSLSK